MLNFYTGERVPDDKVYIYDGFLYIISEHCCIEDGREVRYPDVAEICLCPEYDEPISLADIKERYPDVHIVIHDDVTDGEVFKYGNHGLEPDAEMWELYGETKGYV